MQYRHLFSPINTSKMQILAPKVIVELLRAQKVDAKREVLWSFRLKSSNAKIIICRFAMVTQGFSIEVVDDLYIVLSKCIGTTQAKGYEKDMHKTRKRGYYPLFHFSSAQKRYLVTVKMHFTSNFYSQRLLSCPYKACPNSM